MRNVYPCQQSKCRHFTQIPSGRTRGNRKPSPDNTHSLYPLRANLTASTSPSAVIQRQEFLSMTSREGGHVWGHSDMPRSQSPRVIPAHYPKSMNSLSFHLWNKIHHKLAGFVRGQDEMTHVKPVASGQAKDILINTPQIPKAHREQGQPSKPPCQAWSHTVFTLNWTRLYDASLKVSFLSHFPLSGIWEPTSSAW